MLTLAIERGERRFGVPSDRATDAAASLVARQCEQAAVTLPIQVDQRGRQQRQTADLTCDFVGEPLDERGLDPEAGALTRTLDRTA